MVGNVEEWVADWTEASVGGCTDSAAAFGFPSSDLICFDGYNPNPGFPPPPPAPGPFRRGGMLQDGKHAGVFTVDTSDFPSTSHNVTGFRCARSPH